MIRRRKIYPQSFPPHRRLGLMQERGAAVASPLAIGRFVAVGPQATAAYSDDSGETWSTGTGLHASGNYKGLAFDGSRLVAVGDRVATSDDRGATWTQGAALPGGTVYDAVAWSPSLGLFVAVSSLQYVATSPTGLVWTQRANLPGNSAGYGIAWSAALGLFTCGGYGNASFEQGASSTTGITFADHFLPPPNGTQHTAFLWDATGARFVSSRASGVNGAATSTDGINWTARTTSGGGGWYGVASNGSRYVLAGNGSGVNHSINTSDDGGATWTNRPLPNTPPGGLFGAAWNGARFVATGGGSAAYYSDDGTTWVQATPPAGNWQEVISVD